jgi:predicted nucleic acid-binding protein
LSFYLDTNIVVPLFIPEATSGLLERWLDERGETAVVGDLVAGEFSATISRLVRMGELSPTRAEQIRDHFDAWHKSAVLAVGNEASDIRAAAGMVRKPHPKLLMPDAIHLATCQRLGLTLVTLDLDLADVARVRSIDVLVPE